MSVPYLEHDVIYSHRRVLTVYTKMVLSGYFCVGLGCHVVGERLLDNWV